MSFCSGLKRTGLVTIDQPGGSSIYNPGTGGFSVSGHSCCDRDTRDELAYFQRKFVVIFEHVFNQLAILLLLLVIEKFNMPASPIVKLCIFVSRIPYQAVDFGVRGILVLMGLPYVYMPPVVSWSPAYLFIECCPIEFAGQAAVIPLTEQALIDGQSGEESYCCRKECLLGLK